MNIKTKYLLGLTLLFSTVLICAAFTFTANDKFDLAKQEIMLRKIGHQVLLQSGDSTSRVLPVEKVGDNEYQIRFENELTFNADSLVKIISGSLAKNNLAKDYIVNVRDCSPKGNVIFGYAIAKNAKDDIKACNGRRQPKGCYVINLKFQPSGLSAPQKGMLLGSLPLLAFVGLIVSRSLKNRNSGEPDTTGIEKDNYQIGSTIFHPQKRQLLTGDLTTELTAKESKLLLIFAQSPNAIIERARLQKEIWEDEGVIVGRSLDMFISKLRKKLECDTSIQLINIHGKGYKLEINN